MSKIVSYSDKNKSSEKSFGIVFAVVFLIFSIYPLFSSNPAHTWAFVLSIIFLSLALFLPKILILPNKIWLKIGEILGSIVAPIFMSLVYFITVLPIGVMMRILGKDLLQPKPDKTIKSYWIVRDKPVESMKNQF